MVGLQSPFSFRTPQCHSGAVSFPRELAGQRQEVFGAPGCLGGSVQVIHNEKHLLALLEQTVMMLQEEKVL